MNRVCSKCNEEKNIDQFVKNKTCKDGYARQCKNCSNAYKRWWAKTPDGEVKRLQAKRKYNATHRRKIKERCRVLKKKYGLSLEDYETMCMLQYNRCLICKRDGEELVVDHSHITGEIRGLLCRKCNSALGLFKENIETLQNAIKYVSEHIHNK